MKWYKLLYSPLIYFLLTGCAGTDSYAPEMASTEDSSTEEYYEEATTEEDFTELSSMGKEAYIERFNQKTREFSDLYQLLLDESLDQEMKSEIKNACQDLFKNKNATFKVDNEVIKIRSFLDNPVKNEAPAFSIESMNQVQESIELRKNELMRLSASISGLYNEQAFIGTINAIVIKRSKLFGNKNEQVIELVLSDIVIKVN